MIRALRRRFRLPKGSIALTLFTGLSVALGYVREGVFAYYYGTGAALDAFLAAFTLPKLLLALTTTVTVSALLPVYVGYLRSGSPDRARNLVQQWFAVLVAVLCLVALVLGLAPETAMRLLAPGFDPALTADAGRLLRGLLPYTVAASAAAAYKVVLDSHQRFTAPAAARAVVTVLVIGAAVVAASRLGAWALVVGYGIGGVVMFAIHVAGARGISERPSLRSLRWPRLAGLPLSNVGWITLQMTLGQVYAIVDRIFASGLDTGSIAALNYATAIVTAPQNLVTSVLATVLFPVLAAKVAEGRTDAAIRETGKWVAVVCLTSAPLIGLMILFRVEIVSLLFRRGAFDAESTALVASVLTILPLTIAVGGSNALVNRLLLSQKAYRVTAGLAGVVGAAKVAMNALFVGPFGVAGLALASVLAGVLGLALRVAYAWRRENAPSPTKPGASEPDAPDSAPPPPSSLDP